MSRIDPSIALGVKNQDVESPVDAYGKALTMRNLLNTQALQQQELDEGKQRADLNRETIRGARTRNEAEERVLAGQKALGAAFEKNTKFGEDGKLSVDHDAIEAELTRGGFPEQAVLYNKQRLDYENAALDHAIKQADEQSKQLKKVGGIAQSILNADESLRPALYAAGLKQVGDAANPEALQRIGLTPSYQGKQTDAILQQLSDQAADDPFKQAQERLTAQRAAAEADAKAKDQAADLLKKDVANESQLLGTARSQEDWDKVLGQLRPERRQVYPAKYSNEAKNDAIYMGMSPKERADLGKWNSVAEIASAAAKGDTTATTALKTIQDYEVELDKRKEKNKEVSLTGSGLSAGDISGLGNVPGQRNEDVLKDVDAGTADTIRGIVRGIRPYPSSMAQRLPYWINVLNLAGRYEPGFDATKYAARQKTRSSFSAGPGSNAINALNKLAGHLDNLDQSIDALGNFEGNTVVSSAMNAVRNGLMNKESQKKFNTDRQAVADELESLFRNAGGGGSLEGIKGWKDNFNVNDQTNVLKGAASEAVKLVASQFDAMKQNYESVMGEPLPTDRITPHAREVYKKFGLDIEPDGKAAAPPAVTGKVITEDLMKKARSAKGNEKLDDETIIKAMEAKGYTRPK